MLSGAGHAPTPYAFVRWLKRAPLRNDALEAAGCVRVVYDTEAHSGAAYEVIHLYTIICRHHLVPAFDGKGSFYISAFSPTRPV